MNKLPSGLPSRRTLLAALGATVALPAGAAAQTTGGYPTRPVTIVVPFATGGMADTLARPLANGLREQLGQPFVVVSRPGGSGTVGIQSVARSPADGYTILLTLSSISALPAIAEVEGRPEPFRRGQFSPLARLAADPALVFVHHDAPWRTIEDLIADAKANPGKLSFSSSGLFGPTHIPMEMLLQATGTDMLHVPTSGGAPAMTMLLGRHVDIFFTIPNLGMRHVEAGTLRVLAASTQERLALLPDVPTLIERGINVSYSVWAGIFARADVPANILSLVTGAVERVVADPGYRDALQKAGIVPSYLGPDAFSAFWDDDVTRIAAVVRRAAARSPG